MKRISIPLPPSDTPGMAWVLPVIVDWFPRRTEDEILANAVAVADGKPEPYPDPNLIEIELRRSFLATPHEGDA